MRCGIYVRVSTDDQRDNGYSIDSQLRMIKEYCEKNNYDIVDVYNDAGHFGKDLMRPKMQRLLKDIKSHNYGEHIHLFTSIIKCPDCGKILSSTNSYKNSGTPQAKVYYHVTCKNPNCKSKGIHYSSNKIEEKLNRVLNELTRYMYDIESEIIVCNSSKTKDIKEIDKAIEKLKQQIDPYDELKDYTVELLKKLDCDVENGNVISNNKLAFLFSSRKIENEKYSQVDLEKYMALLAEHFYKDGVITCPYIEDGNVTDHLTLISKI